jgi:hypothetical protein
MSGSCTPNTVGHRFRPKKSGYTVAPVRSTRSPVSTKKSGYTMAPVTSTRPPPVRQHSLKHKSCNLLLLPQSPRFVLLHQAGRPPPMLCQAMLEINTLSMCMHVNGYIRTNEIHEIIVLNYTPLESLELVHVGCLRVTLIAE